MKKILVITLSNLGDVVLTLPVFQSLRHANPSCQIDVMVSHSAKIVFENDPRIRKILPYDKKKSLREKWAMIRAVREEHYDVIVDLRRSLIGYLGGAKKRNQYFTRRSKSGHRFFYHLHSMRGLAPVWNEESFLRERSRRSVVGTETSSQRMVVAAVGSKSDIKKWPAESYAKLLDRLAQEEQMRVILVGDSPDKADADKVKALMRSEALDLTGKTSFDELVSVLSRASLVVTNDSAPLHIADALRVPTLAIFGPTSPKKYGPRGRSSLAVSKNLFCSPCEKAQCRFSHECMKELSVDEVYQKALSVLNDEAKHSGLKLLAIRLDRIGDAVLTLPALQALREQFPESRISVLARPATREIFEGHPAVDEVIVYDYKKGGRHTFPVGYFRLLQEILRRRFDAAFLFHPGLRSSLLPVLAGIPYRVGYAGPLSFLQTHNIEDRRHEGAEHESVYALEMAGAFAALPQKEYLAQWPVSEYESAQTIEKFLGNHSKKWIAIHPGSSCPSKRWPLERFTAVCKELSRESGLGLVVVGGKEEQVMGAQLKKEAGENIIDLTGKLSLKELAQLFNHCELLISNDSGPVHIAAAVGTKVISIFGRNQAGLSAKRWRPLGQGHTVIQKDVGCVVCLAHECTIDFECLKAISVEEVLNAAHKTLAADLSVV